LIFTFMSYLYLAFGDKEDWHITKQPYWLREKTLLYKRNKWM
jgi:hypothetical protein